MSRVLLLAGLLIAGAATAADDARTLCFAKDLRACDRAVAAAPDDIALRRHYALLLLGNRLEDDAIVQLSEIIRRHPSDPRAHADLAAAFATLNRFSEALAPIERALALGSDDLYALQLAAIAFRAAKRWDALAQVDLRAAAKGDRLAMYELAELYGDGLGVGADPAAAFGWLLRAAEAGHIGAMDRLAEIFRDGGLGQMPDALKAAHWQKRADEADGS